MQRFVRALFLTTAAVGAFGLACVVKPHPPSPTPAVNSQVAITTSDGQTAIDLTVTAWTDDQGAPHVDCPPDAPNHAVCAVSGPTGNGLNVHAVADGYDATDGRGVIGGTTTVTLQKTPPPIPPAPTRDQALNLCTTFQGLTAQTPTYGTLPMFEAALPWMAPADRQAVYAAKHASAVCGAGGDTHLVIQIPSGPALYDEPGQPYSADRFPPLDWTHGNTAIDPQLNALVVEVRQNGFVPVLFMQEDQPTSAVEMPLVVRALQADAHGDLTAHVVIMPGWDGVFYGWSPEQIVDFGNAFRALAPNGYLGLEHQPGRFPVGEGGDDWRVGGRMTVYDLLLGEFNSPPNDDTLWQIAARALGQPSLGGTYVRPADQPAGDDPNPPWYLATGNPRGKVYACFFEFDEYSWVRSRASVAQINKERAYGLGVGYSCGG